MVANLIYPATLRMLPRLPALIETARKKNYADRTYLAAFDIRSVFRELEAYLRDHFEQHADFLLKELYESCGTSEEELEKLSEGVVVGELERLLELAKQGDKDSYWKLWEMFLYAKDENNPLELVYEKVSPDGILDEPACLIYGIDKAFFDTLLRERMTFILSWELDTMSSLARVRRWLRDDGINRFLDDLEEFLKPHETGEP